jgi:DNA-binding NtrC family response regulator
LCRQHRLPSRQITEGGKQRLLACRWPGNVRELAHELERGLVFEDSAALDFSNLSAGPSCTSPELVVPGDWLNSCFNYPEEGFNLEDAINRLVQRALNQASGNVSCAARMLGVTRDFVRYRLHGDRRVPDAKPDSERKKSDAK